MSYGSSAMEGGTGTAALVVSIVSIVLAVLALLWNIMNVTLLDRARLDVSLEFGMKLVGGSPDTDRDVVLVSATNIGKRPVRLTSLWLVSGRPFPRWGKAIPKKWRQRYTKGVMQPGDDPMLVAMSATIPAMLGVGEQAVVYSYEETVVLDAAKKLGHTHAYAEAGGSTARGRSNVVQIPLAD